MSVSNNFPAIRPSLSLDFANTKTLDPRITFTRSTTATCYDGVTTAKAEENLALYSQEFDNATWAKNSVTATANTTTAPDGTTTADTITPNTSSTYHYLNNNNSFPATVGLQYIRSVYAKANGYTKISLGHTNVAGTIFDLSIGSVVSDASGYTGTITSVGNGWYRCSTVRNATSAAEYQTIMVADASNNVIFAGDGTSGVYLWGAQVEQRSSVTSYTPTTSQPITNYIPVLQTAAANVARFEHDPVTGESLGLLVEEQRTNLVTYSEDFSTISGWNYLTNSSIQSNTVVSPDGTLTADKLVESAASGAHGVGFTTAIFTAGVTYAISVFAKAAERSYLSIAFSNDTSDTATFNLSTGTIASQGTGNLGASIQSVGNGWYRCTSIMSPTKANPYPTFRINDGSSDSYTGDGYSGVYLWGAQLEAGSFPTSYIPTTSAAVTRTADTTTISTAGWWSYDAGTVFAEHYGFGGSGFPRVWNGGNATGAVALYGGIPHLILDKASTGTVAFVYTGYNTWIKSAASFGSAYASNSLVANGGAAATGTSAFNLSVTDFRIGHGNSNTYLNGTIKKISYYPQRLSNTELQALTA